jgi:hypothetical protein
VGLEKFRVDKRAKTDHKVIIRKVLHLDDVVSEVFNQEFTYVFYEIFRIFGLKYVALSFKFGRVELPETANNFLVDYLVPKLAHDDWVKLEFTSV